MEKLHPFNNTIVTYKDGSTDTLRTHAPQREVYESQARAIDEILEIFDFGKVYKILLSANRPQHGNISIFSIEELKNYVKTILENLYIEGWGTTVSMGFCAHRCISEQVFLFFFDGINVIESASSDMSKYIGA